MSRRVLTRPAPLTPIAAGLLWYPRARCPGCFGRQFHIGRITAECATCAAPLIIASNKDVSDDQAS